MRTRVVLLCVIVALATWLIAFYVAINVPGSPFQELLGVVERVSDPRTGPAAFKEFLALGERTRLIGAIVFPLAAGIAVALLSWFRVRLRWSEAMTVVAVFSVFLFLWSGGIGYFGFADLAPIVIFLLTVAISVGWTRSATAD